MPKMMREVYYSEPRIKIFGRYNRDVSIEKALEIKERLTKEYGPLLYRIDIDCSRKKKNPDSPDSFELHIRPNLYKTLDAVPCFFTKSDFLDKTQIEYVRYYDNPAAYYVVDENRSVIEADDPSRYKFI